MPKIFYSLKLHFKCLKFISKLLIRSLISNTFCVLRIFMKTHKQLSC